MANRQLIPRRYSLRTLLALLAIGPPVLAGTWIALPSVGDLAAVVIPLFIIEPAVFASIGAGALIVGIWAAWSGTRLWVFRPIEAALMTLLGSGVAYLFGPGPHYLYEHIPCVDFVSLVGGALIVGFAYSVARGMGELAFWRDGPLEDDSP